MDRERKKKSAGGNQDRRQRKERRQNCGREQGQTIKEERIRCPVIEMTTEKATNHRDKQGCVMPHLTL